jgi:hypothetical protein
MKKTLLAFALSIILPAFAQVQVTAPTAPSPSTTIVVSPNAAAALATATTNKIFVDQSGDNPTVNLNQTGSGNRQGNATGTGYGPVYLRGIDQKITTIQTGSNNEIDLKAVNATVGTGKGVNVTIQQLGNSNKLDASCGSGFASNGTTALSGCDNADLNWKFTGNSNEFQFRGTGTDLKSAATISGNLNKFYIDAIGDKQTQTLVVGGNSNEFNLSQSSTGTSGSSIEINQTGDGVKFNVNQSGTVDSVLYIKSVANSGTFNINQKTQ